MLQNIRNNIQGTAAKVIIAIIVVPFAFFGIDSLFSGGSQTPAAVVNGEKISQAELQQALAMQKRRLINMMGDKLEPSMLDDAVLRKPALDSLIKQQLLLQAAEDAGIEISDQQLNITIASMPQFQEDGRFSQERYQQVLRLQGYNSALFKQLLRSDLLIQQLSASVAASAFVTERELDEAIAYIHESRDFQTVTVPLEKYRKSITLTDEELKSYYEENGARFQSEPKVKVSYLELKEEQFYEPVSEQQVVAEYERLIEGMTQDTEREAAHILLEIDDELNRDQAVAKLNEVKQRLLSGESFAELAKSLSEDPGSASNGGNLGFTAGDSFPAEFEDALAALEAGQVSDPVETEAGVHLIKLLSVKQPEVPSLDSERLAITERLRRQKARPKLLAAVESLRDLVFNAESLAMPAAELELEVKRSDWLSSEDNDGLFADQRVKQAAFDSELREQELNSDVFELAPDHFLVLHVDQYQAPQLRPFEDVRAEIEVSLQTEKAAQQAKADAQEIEQQLAAGQRAEAVAKQHGLDWQAMQDIRRSDISVEPALRRFVFELAAPAQDKAVAATLHQQSGDYTVVQLLASEPGQRAALEAEALLNLRRSVAQNASSQAFANYFNNLWNNADITIN
ncbi:MAG: SurA N-terminal domain-containing protein [Spongiibacter marinus]|uniref:SurA N-terminal domain-containing protein n=1 Tax=Spongiibacter marinus TaxID=354246 RepID=UPI003C54C579